VNGQCSTAVSAGFCLICGACVPEGTRNGANGCEACNPSINSTAWSVLPDGEPCYVNLGVDLHSLGFHCAGGMCCPPTELSMACEIYQCGNACGTECGSCVAAAESCDAHFCTTAPDGCDADSDCDDGNECSWDSCTAQGVCAHALGELPQCCLSHADCGPGGPWDDGIKSTVDYCLDSQCVHALNPCFGCWDYGKGLCNDGNPCTVDICAAGDCYCEHTWIDGCCIQDHECAAANPAAHYLCTGPADLPGQCEYFSCAAPK
jgi:hypothetical protein